MAHSQPTESDRVKQSHVNLAIETISRSDELSGDYADLFDGTTFLGTNKQLTEIRHAMRDYEKNEASFGEETTYYNARLNLQYLLDMDE